MAPTNPQETYWIRLRRHARAGVLAIGVCLLLVGCGEGTRRDAEQGREQDAEETHVLDSLQSTYTASLISGTPMASPTPEDEED